MTELVHEQLVVAAHNADAYNPGRGSAQKRKRDKAQEQLRHRMRRRNNGTSSSMVSSRLKNSSHSGMGETTQVKGVKTVWHTIKNNSKDEWQTQEAHYSALAHPDRVTGGEKKARHEVVPLGELVDRVMQRRGHMKDTSPMTIRAIKPPAPPYAIQQPSLIRKMVHVQQPITKRKPKSSGPYVVVLKRDISTKSSDLAMNTGSKALPPIKQQNNSEDVEMGTWRPELETNHKPYIHPNAEDRSVTNYRLQMQQAIKIAELRGDFTTSTKPMHKHAPLPAIQVSYEVHEDQPLETSVKVELDVDATTATEEPIIVEQKEKQVDNQESVKIVTKDSNVLNPNRFTSSKEVLTQMQARKQAKRRKIKGDDFNNPLRTRNRYTAKSKQFKADINKERELSMIQEDQSSISDRLSRLSAGRTSVASFRSVASLKRIEETEVPGDRTTRPQAGRNRGLNITETPTRGDEHDTQPSAKEDENGNSDPERGLCPEYSSEHCSSKNNIHGAKHNNETKSEFEPSKTDTIITDTDKPSTMSKDESICQTSSVVVQTSSEIDQNMVWIPGKGSPSPDSFTDSETEASNDDPSTFSQDNNGEFHNSDRTTDDSLEGDSNKSNRTSENPDKSEDDSLVVMDTIKQQSVDRFREADSHQGIPALETFDRRDMILPAETVQ
ncbi:uncharacterized protein [Asterias amurensis]|uniref:uncharacterized protein isoform X2 n=1 Tax=Asterias amurensis TaxID=7602 RepID=UPI003AB88EE8